MGWRSGRGRRALASLKIVAEKFHGDAAQMEKESLAEALPVADRLDVTRPQDAPACGLVRGSVSSGSRVVCQPEGFRAGREAKHPVGGQHGILRRGWSASATSAACVESSAAPRVTPDRSAANGTGARSLDSPRVFAYPPLGRPDRAPLAFPATKEIGGDRYRPTPRPRAAFRRPPAWRRGTGAAIGRRSNPRCRSAVRKPPPFRPPPRIPRTKASAPSCAVLAAASRSPR